MTKKLIYILFLITAFSAEAHAKRCLLVMSYHQGYAWNDGVEQGVRKTLQDKCELEVFYMNTKLNKSKDYARQKASEAKKLIEKFRPDVVIASDDNASRYLVQPYYKDKQLPFVFCAVNWTTKKYGYPYSNVTGMIEVAPILPLLHIARKTLKTKHLNAVYIGADTFTEKKNFKRFHDIYSKQDVKLSGVYARDVQQWKALYKKAQSADLLILGSNAGINGWDDANIKQFVNSNTKKFSVTNHHWMQDFAMYAMSKVPEEQGEWAAEAALHIINGTAPKDIPIAVNRKWKININDKLIKNTDITLPPREFANIH